MFLWWQHWSLAYPADMQSWSSSSSSPSFLTMEPIYLQHIVLDAIVVVGNSDARTDSEADGNEEEHENAFWFGFWWEHHCRRSSSVVIIIGAYNSYFSNSKRVAETIAVRTFKYMNCKTWHVLLSLRRRRLFWALFLYLGLFVCYASTNVPWLEPRKISATCNTSIAACWFLKASWKCQTERSSLEISRRNQKIWIICATPWVYVVE